MEEVKVWNDKREREMYDNFAELLLYAIVKDTERVEKAYYVRHIIIKHYTTTVPSIERFDDTYNMDCLAAMNRLDVEPCYNYYSFMAATLLYPMLLHD